MSDREILKRGQSVLVDAAVYESNDERCLIEFDFMGQLFSGCVCRTKVHAKSEQDKVQRIRDFINNHNYARDTVEEVNAAQEMGRSVMDFISELDGNEGES